MILAFIKYANLHYKVRSKSCVHSETGYFAERVEHVYTPFPHPGAAAMVLEVLFGFPWAEKRQGSHPGPAEQAALESEGRLFFPAGTVAVGVV